MRIILPPSETKAPGGAGAPLDPAALGFPELAGVRAEIAADLTALAADRDRAMAALGLGPRLAAEVDADRELATAPTMAALDRYTGVLYDALDAATLGPAERSRLLIGSALFGLLRADDPIPRYRLSAGAKLPRRDDPAAAPPTMRARWAGALPAALATLPGPVLDLRSGGYVNLGRAPGAITARVVTAAGKVVSHHNKHHKGLLARALARADAERPLADPAAMAAAARAAGLDAATAGEAVIEVTVHPG